MADSHSQSDGPSFENQLSELIELAHENGTNVEGGWKCTTNGGDRHWDVQIVPVRYDE
jgi:hypothetical protein